MKKPTEAKAHGTTAEGDESDSNSDEDEDIPQAEVYHGSFSCIFSTNALKTQESLV